MENSEDKKGPVYRKLPAPFMGVCSGLAEHYDFDVLPLRLIVLMAWMVMPMPTLLMYMMIGWCVMELPKESE